MTAAELGAIDAAVEHYRELLTKQAERALAMEKSAPAVDYSTKDRIVVGLIEGDGIGPLIVRQARKVLDALLKDEIASGRVEFKPISGLTIENRRESGKSVPDDVMADIKSCDVLLKGPTETPKGGSLESANVTLRRELDLYANVRPVKVESEGIDWAFFRENTEGEYTLGSQGIEMPELLTMDFKVITNAGTRRICRAACEYAIAHGKTRIHIVTKANIMKKTDGSFSEICHEVVDSYPGLTADDYYIDIMTAKLLEKDTRKNLEVFVLPNLYGDIITDEAAQIQGGVGTAGSANIGDRYAFFEAIHGTAPALIAQGLGSYANPMSILKAAAMMLSHIGYTEKSDRLERILEKVNLAFQPEAAAKERSYAGGFTGGRDGITTNEFCDHIIGMLGC